MIKLKLEPVLSWFKNNMIPFEDQFYDVLVKAKRGLGLHEEVIAQITGLTSDVITELLQGKLRSDADLKKIAKVFQLNGEALLDLEQKKWQPKMIHLEGLTQFCSAWDETSVNAYLVWDEESRKALAFDTGTDAQEMLNFLESKQLKLEAVFITHTHGDHVFELDRIQEITKTIFWVCDKESLEGAQNFEPGHCFELGKWQVETRLTNGHSPGGTTYFLKGLDRPVAFVGDALFAGSMGGVATTHYQEAQKKIRENILSLPNKTILCPGHGPMTTVEEEKEHNPFFAEELNPN